MTIEEKQHAVVLRAAELLKEQDALKAQLRANEAQLLPSAASTATRIGRGASAPRFCVKRA